MHEIMTTTATFMTVHQSIASGSGSAATLQADSDREQRCYFFKVALTTLAFTNSYGKLLHT